MTELLPAPTPPRPRAGFLFAGGGGLHLGFREAGFDTVFCTDIEETAASTFVANFPEVPFVHGDVRHLTRPQVEQLAGGLPVDVIVGGPPCQGFSTLGDQVQGDPRNSLFEAFARVVKWLEPKCVLVENTSYLRSQYAGRYETEVRRALEALGYRVDVATLNAADYGTPQIRKRAFFVGTRRDAAFLWPARSHVPAPHSILPPYITVGDTIMDIADADEHRQLPNHTALRHSDTVLARYRLVPEGGRLPPPQELPEAIRRRNFGNTYKRLDRARPSLTLVPGNNAFPIHPTEDRSLTPREGARLQGFPDTYVFSGSRAEQCKLVGNAVPVPLARALAAAFVSHLRDHAATEAPCPDAGPVAAAAPELPEQGAEQLALDIAAADRATARRSSVPRPKASRQLTAVSFFTGAGGMLLGFERAGLEVLASYDRKSVVAKNCAVNFPAVPHHHRDVTAMTAAEVRADVGGRRIDVVFGGSPCQGFSIFGKRRFVHTRGHKPEADERNELTLKYVDLAVSLSPRAIVLENVRGLVSTPRNDSTYLAEVEAILHAGGYRVTHRVLNCADYGVPQLRERFVLVATAPGVEFAWPAPKYHARPKSWQRPYATVGDVLTDLADPATHSAELSHVPMEHKALLVERYALIPEGGRLPERDLPDHLRKGYRSDNVRNYSHVYRRLSRGSPATTMVPGHNAFPVHPTLPRTLTVREAARIQTFPDAMRFVGTRQQQCMLVGNAVPPVLAEQIAQAVVKALRGNARQKGYKADHYELKAGV